MLGSRGVLVLVVVALLAGGGGAETAEARKAPKGLFGLGDWSFPRDADVAAMQKHGLRWWRTTLNWGAVEACRGTYDFSGSDQIHDREILRARRAVRLPGCREVPRACPRRPHVS